MAEKDDKAKAAAAVVTAAVGVVVLVGFYLLLIILLLAMARALGFLPRGWPSIAPEPAAYLAGAYYLLRRSSHGT